MDRASVESFELEQPVAFRDSALFVDYYGLREQPLVSRPIRNFFTWGKDTGKRWLRFSMRLSPGAGSRRWRPSRAWARLRC
jgi:hypothetical protein